MSHDELKDLKRLLASQLAPGTSAILVDEDAYRDELEHGGTPRLLPFLEREGVYWGRPTDDAEAIGEVERLRDQGAAAIVFARHTQWWLEYYAALHDHLRASYRRVPIDEPAVVFDLQHAADDTAFDEAVPTVRLEATSGPPIVQRVRGERLTYLDEAALCQLRSAVLDVEQKALTGILIEAGCALGGSALVMAASKASIRPLHVFDMFGLIPPPSAEDGEDVQHRYALIRSGRSEGIAGDTYYGYVDDLYERVRTTFVQYGFDPEWHNVHLISGEFQRTVVGDDPVVLAHIDCDWYESVKICLERIVPRLVPGGALIIDDYYAWSGCRRAVDEYFRHRAGFTHRTVARLQITRN